VTSHLSGIEFVAHYLYRTKSVFEFSFVTLSVAQGEHSEPALENDIKFWEKRAATDPTTELGWNRYKDVEDDLINLFDPNGVWKSKQG